MPIIECIANVSEGQRGDVIQVLAEAIAAIPDVRLLDVQSDPSHHRSVFSFAGSPAPMKAATLTLFDHAIALIDLRAHHGEHPRIGAVDVVPFVPIDGCTMSDCVALARDVGHAVAERHQLPVFLYEQAASAPHRQRLEDLRRGGFEGLGAKLRDPQWHPDFGPDQPHLTAGATVIGARPPLVAYNINLATNRLEVARAIARAVRHSSGGLRFVKAMGVRLHERDIVQVSMNLTDYRRTPIPTVFEMVRREAARHGVAILESEIIGLVPADALFDAAAYYLQIAGFGRHLVLEERLRATAGPPRPPLS